MTRNGVITTKVRLLRAVVHLISIALLLIIVAVVTRQSGPQLAQLRCVIRRVQDGPQAPRHHRPLGIAAQTQRC